MIHVKFDPQGGDISIEILYFGNLTASYVYSLWEKNSNTKKDEKTGNNQNSDDDKYDLPSPASDNEGRIVEVFSTLNNPSGGGTEKEIVAIRLWQGRRILLSEENPDGFKVGGKTFTLTEQKIIDAGKTELSDPFIKLIV